MGSHSDTVAGSLAPTAGSPAGTMCWSASQARTCWWSASHYKCDHGLGTSFVIPPETLFLRFCSRQPSLDDVFKCVPSEDLLVERPAHTATQTADAIAEAATQRVLVSFGSSIVLSSHNRCATVLRSRCGNYVPS